LKHHHENPLRQPGISRYVLVVQTRSGFIAKKAAQPPLGLLTVASLLPAAWEKKLVDLNLTALTSQDLQWADYVFLGVIGKERLYYWKLFFGSIFCRPRNFSTAMTLAIYGFHFRRVFEQYL
jgi:hypothetical protein